MDFDFNLDKPTAKTNQQANSLKQDAELALLLGHKNEQMSKLLKEQAEAILTAGDDSSKLKKINDIFKDHESTIENEYNESVHILKHGKNEDNIRNAGTVGSVLGMSLKDSLTKNKTCEFLKGFWNGLKQ